MTSRSRLFRLVSSDSLLCFCYVLLPHTKPSVFPHFRLAVFLLSIRMQ